MVDLVVSSGHLIGLWPWGNHLSLGVQSFCLFQLNVALYPLAGIFLVKTDE